MAKKAPKARILVLDDKEFELESTCELLRDEGYEVAGEQDPRSALDRLEGFAPQVVVTDLAMPGLDGLEVLQAVKQQLPNTEVVLITGHGGVREAVEAMRKGAFDFITKGPTLPDELAMACERATAQAALKAEVESLRKQVQGRYGFHAIVGHSPKMQEIYELLESVAQHDATVLVHGENGTGKELVARAVHAESPRRDGAFVAVNCSALSETLLESELFGHVKGAFTGAIKDRVGCFEQAKGGTLLLDEVGDIPLQSQPKLLRVLQEREIQRVGESHTRKVDARIIACTNRDLKAMVAAGEFREDLYFRLRVVTVTLPSLRERLDDLPLLCEHIIGSLSQKMGLPKRSVPPEALRDMMSYGWPGNVRELYHALERALIVGKGDEVQPRDLPPEVGEGGGPAAPAAQGHMRVDGLLANERLLVQRVLDEAGWNIHEASRRLEISRPTLYSKIEKHGLKRPK